VLSIEDFLFQRAIIHGDGSLEVVGELRTDAVNGADEGGLRVVVSERSGSAEVAEDVHVVERAPKMVVSARIASDSLASLTGKFHNVWIESRGADGAARRKRIKFQGADPLWRPYVTTGGNVSLRRVAA
jgi:hypothetical protein